ncbi:ABC transporter substrate-binding protein [Jongsikchunia kroppenstedtii]|uniref:ABC transporter substrate-binding protein n=1 Tax=Jongsikchunia kroppenstedtii TaxID=1121721 RepID=UPI00036A1156|nr:ABC transporter substrate-binding protein [Jongsikchunia kroppenstedtii]
MIARRLTILVVVIIAATLGLAGCSSKAADDKRDPVQVNLPDGTSVTINGTPKRIVTLGDQWTDIALQFGITPVAYYDGLKQQTKEDHPWYGGKMKDVPLIQVGGDAVGQVAKARPDLILAPGFGQEQTQALANIAPMIGKISGQQVDPWEDMVRLFGTIIHQPGRANEIIQDTNAKIAALRQSHPNIVGKTYAFALIFGADQIQVLADPNDGAAKLFSQLGFQIDPRLVAEGKKAGQARFALSAEQVPMLNADLLVISATTPALQERLGHLPGYTNLTAVRNNAYTFLSLQDITALNQPSPGGIDYVLDRLDPTLGAVR